MDIEARFWELCDKATSHDEASYRKSCDDSVSPEEIELEARASEQAMVEIIDFVEKHPEGRPTFVNCFSDLVLWKRPAPSFLVAFCMRRLRFPEIREVIARDAKEHEGTEYYASHMNFWSHINHAYLDEVWENAICFDFYRHEISKTLDDWIAREAISCSLDSDASLNDAVDRLAASLDRSVELLGLGEPTHGVEAFLRFRNRVFQRLVEAHGFTAIAVESSFPRGRVVNEYVLGRGATSFEDIQESGFSHGFGRMAANRELVEWMRAYNADAGHAAKLHFYGFDSPTEMMYADSPRRMLEFVLDYLGEIDADSARARRERITELIGQDADWENQAAAMDSSKSIGLSEAATSLRIAVEELSTELWIRRPEFVAATDVERYAEAVHYSLAARQQLVYHAAMAGTSEKRLVELLGIRDAMMAENLAYIVSRERPRGKVLAYAHNMHLKYGKAEWQWGPNLMTWWPAGSHVKQMLGSRYAVIGVSAGESDRIGLPHPEPGTLEALLSDGPGVARFVPTHLGQGLPAPAVIAIPTRSPSTKTAYFPFSSQSVTDFDWLAVLGSVD